jgi:polar amino acid transport system substrate-binding protein
VKFSTFKNVFCASVLCSMSFSSAQARPLDQIMKSGKVIVATEGQFPPFNFFKSGKLAGFEVDVAEMLAKKMGLVVEWKTLPFDSLLIGLAQDRYDFVIASHGVTPERSRAVLFTEPHYCTGGVIVGKGKEISKNALKNFVVGVQVGTSYVTALQSEKLYKELKTFPKDTDALQSLMAGKVDAWVTDRFVALEAVGRAPELKVGQAVFTERVAMAVALGNTSLADALNLALANARKDGTYVSLSKQYFKTDIGCGK